MEGAEEARRQREQLSRYLCWVREEGGVEGPTWLDTIWKPHQQRRLRWLREHCVGTVMELGCSWGWVLSFCGGQIGVDHNPHSVALASILSPGREFVVADIRELPFPDGHVSTVMVADCLEHLPWEEVPRAVAEAKRVARRKLLVTVPGGDGPDATSMKHVWLMTLERMSALEGMLLPWPTKLETDGDWVLLEAVRP